MSENLDLFHSVLSQGVEEKASDFHIKEGAPISLRVAGQLMQLDLVPTKEFMEEIIHKMGTPEQLAKYKETGDLDVSYSQPGIGRFRVNAHRQRGKHAMTLRHVKDKIFTFEQLGLPPVLKSISEAERGIIIICGTTGSGKSTTLAAMLQNVNTNYAKHIITIEDPIEYEFTDAMSFFEQREVGLDTISFYSALVHALRQDPDIIMVGEMRDRESFEAALQAADTGHLVISTLHATNASQVINRILDFYPHAEQAPIREALALNLCATISQRLLPRAFGGGVVPVNEIMINTPIVRKLLEKDMLEKLPQAIEGGKEDGMQSYNQALLKLINNGDITEEDGLAAATEPEALKMNLKGIFLGSDNAILG